MPLFRRILIAPFVAAVQVYQYTLSPFIGGHCRYVPRCSDYALAAYRAHGVLGGSYLTLRRLLRCHPWGGCGRDPVPEQITLLSKRKPRKQHGSSSPQP